MSVGGLYKSIFLEYRYWSTKDNGEYFYSSAEAGFINSFGSDFTESDVKICTRMGPGVLADWGNEVYVIHGSGDA